MPPPRQAGRKADLQMAQRKLNYDVVVVGAGVAGLAFILELAKSCKVGLFCKGEKVGGASSWAQGGLAAAISSGDNAKDHFDDTMEAGRGLCDVKAARRIIEQGRESINWLEGLGVRFSRCESGGLDLGREGGHRRNRIVHASDATGAAIISSLAAHAESLPNVTFHTNETAIDLVTDANDQVAGLYSLNRASGKVSTISAPTVVLATGGVGKVYRYTTNPDESTGDGIAMAWRCGCEVVNMEFVQFHPTTLYHPHAKSVLISEACRGAGAVLVDQHGERFMKRHHGDAELAPRDIVARAIDAEMKRSGADCVFLDFSALTPEELAEKFPTISRRCAALGVDIAARPVPVVPSAHYLCGGIATSVDGATSIDGLYAIGETAYTGLHGANRLASNSLLECIVVARAAAQDVSSRGMARRASASEWDASRVGPAHEEVMVAHNWDEVRRTMWNYVGIVRSDERLARAQRRIELIAEEVEEHYRHFVVSSDFIELRNLLLCSQLIIKSARSRRESRGLHYNVDVPDTTEIAANTVIARNRSHAATSVVERVLHAN